MKRSGFTMIELIFVIVILGILAAVALPKFIGVSEEAQVSKLKGYVGTLNRTVSPALWSKSISEGHSGRVTGGEYDDDLNSTLPPLENIADNGDDFDIPTLNGLCTGNTAAEIAAATVGGTAVTAVGDLNGSILIGEKAYSVGCIDGNMTAAPQFYLLDKDQKVVVK